MRTSKSNLYFVHVHVCFIEMLCKTCCPLLLIVAVQLTNIAHAVDERLLEAYQYGMDGHQGTDQRYQNFLVGLKAASNLSTTRSFRSIHGITNPAIKALLKGAEEVSTASEKYRKFIKRGQVQTAIQDFNRLKWTSEVERVELKTNKGRRPTILVFDPSNDSPLKIIYLKDRH